MSRKPKTHGKTILMYPFTNEREWITPESWKLLPKQNRGQKVVPIKTLKPESTDQARPGK